MNGGTTSGYCFRTHRWFRLGRLRHEACRSRGLALDFADHCTVLNCIGSTRFQVLHPVAKQKDTRSIIHHILLKITFNYLQKSGTTHKPAGERRTDENRLEKIVTAAITDGDFISEISMFVLKNQSCFIRQRRRQ